jgi:CheY-like chemotaxis protein
VEDEENDVFFMQLAFGKAGLGHLFRTVPNGREAMHYLSGAAGYADRDRFPLPAAMLLDLSLPLVSGFQVLEWVRQQARFHRLPIVMFSGSVRAEDREKAFQLGATDYIEKPTSPLKFINLVEWLTNDWLAGSDPKVRRA